MMSKHKRENTYITEARKKKWPQEKAWVSKARLGAGKISLRMELLFVYGKCDNDDLKACIITREFLVKNTLALW